MLSWSAKNKTGTRVAASFRSDEYEVVAWTSGQHAGRFSAFFRKPRIRKRGKRKGERMWSMWFPIYDDTGSQFLPTMEEAKALCDAHTEPPR
jgi:hypothetical protein